jgi:hypothetical protein
MIFLGFSVQAEPAHQNQERFPFIRRWVKEHLPITNTAGVATGFINLQTLSKLHPIPGEKEQATYFPEISPGIGLDR